jgi:magnesium transporter
MWLAILFFGALLTAFALKRYEKSIDDVAWLVMFLPLIISSGGNTGSQSATLIITALSTGDISLRDWWRVVKREIATGMILGSFLGAIGYIVAITIGAMLGEGSPSMHDAAAIPLTLFLVVICGTLTGSMLPLVFRRLGLDPAIMSNPFVSCICDIVGIVIYMQVAIFLLH